MIAGSVFSEEDTISCSVCCTLVGNGKLDSISNFNSSGFGAGMEWIATST